MLRTILTTMNDSMMVYSRVEYYASGTSALEEDATRLPIRKHVIPLKD